MPELNQMSALMVSCLTLNATEAIAQTCDVETSIPSDYSQISAGTINDSSSFDEAVTGGDKLYIRLSNLSLHASPLEVRVFRSPGGASNQICSYGFNIGPFKTALLSGNYFSGGQNVEYRVSVSAGPVDAASVGVQIYSKKNIRDPNDGWQVALFNLDDSMDVVLNGVNIGRCVYRKNCSLKIDDKMRVGSNTLMLSLRNVAGPWTYGYKITNGKKIIAEDKCGDSSPSPSRPCKDQQTGVVWSRTFNVVK